MITLQVDKQVIKIPHKFEEITVKELDAIDTIFSNEKISEFEQWVDVLCFLGNVEKEFFLDIPTSKVAMIISEMFKTVPVTRFPTKFGSYSVRKPGAVTAREVVQIENIFKHNVPNKFQLIVAMLCIDETKSLKENFESLEERSQEISSMKASIAIPLILKYSTKYLESIKKITEKK